MSPDSALPIMSPARPPVNSRRRSIAPAGRLLACAVIVGASVACGADDSTDLSNDDVAAGRHELPHVVRVDATQGPSCQSCTIKETGIVVLGSESDSISVRGLRPWVVRDSRGYTYVADAVIDARPQPVMVYDTRGRLTATVGRPGQGPGEYQVALGLLLGTHDSVGVLHPPGRVSWFAPDGTFGRQTPAPLGSATGIVLLRNGSLVAGGHIRTPRSEGLPLHMTGSGSAEVRSFGPRDVVIPDYGPSPVVAASGDSAVWVAEEINYRLEQLDSGGNTLRIVLVNEPASRAYLDRAEMEAAGNDGTSRPGRSVVRGIFEDGTGLLWVLRHMAHPDPKRHPVLTPEEASECMYSGECRDSGMYTVIDVIDVSGRRLVAQRGFDGERYFANDGTLIRLLFTGEGLTAGGRA
jgi:hypothetical protein